MEGLGTCWHGLPQHERPLKDMGLKQQKVNIEHVNNIFD